MMPERVGRYQIRSELGRGGMATVYVAHDPQFEREVAVKILPPEFLHDPSFRARFKREAQTIASLEHPAIVPVYDFGEDAQAGLPYLVMRLMGGGSLADRLRHGPMPLEQAAHILTRLASALDEAHAHGIIHRDLKPGNILFDQRGNPYISDFGLAKLAETGKSLTGSVILGTPEYMSPEQARGAADLDRRSDVYALGVILYEMLTGRPPYKADTPMGIAVMHITDPVPRILEAKPDLAPGCEIVITRAMAKKREIRYATASEMVLALDKAVRGEEVPAAPLGEAATVALTSLYDARTVPLPAPIPERISARLPQAQQEKRRQGLIWLWLLLALLACGLLSGLALWSGGSLPLTFGQAATATPTPTHAAVAPTATNSSRLSATPQLPVATLSTRQPTVTVQTAASATPKKAATPEASPTNSPLNPATVTPASRPTETPRVNATSVPTALPSSTSAPAATNTKLPPSNTPPVVNTVPPLPTNTPPPTDTPPPSATPTPADTTGPSVTGLNANPNTVGALNGCSVTFRATITDPSGVASAVVNWAAYNSLNGSAGAGSVPLSGPATGGAWLVTFNVTVPLAGRLEWGVTALDTVGNSTAQSGGPRVNAVAACS